MHCLVRASGSESLAFRLLAAIMQTTFTLPGLGRRAALIISAAQPGRLTAASTTRHRALTVIQYIVCTYRYTRRPAAQEYAAANMMCSGSLIIYQ